MKSLDRVQRLLEGDNRPAAGRSPRTGPSPDAAATAARQLRRRGEAQLGQSSPTVIWRKPSTR